MAWQALIPFLAPLILGGSYAVGEHGRKKREKRDEERELGFIQEEGRQDRLTDLQEAEQKRLRMAMMFQGLMQTGKLGNYAKANADNIMDSMMQTQGPTDMPQLQKVPGFDPSIITQALVQPTQEGYGVTPTTEKPATQGQPSAPATQGQPGEPQVPPEVAQQLLGAAGLPEDLLTINVSKEGEMSFKLEQNKEAIKQKYQAEAAQHKNQVFQANRHKGLAVAKQTATWENAMKYGYVDDKGAFDKAFPDKTVEEKYNTVRTMMIRRLSEHRPNDTFESIRQEFTGRFKSMRELSHETWQGIQQDAFNAYTQTVRPLTRKQAEQEGMSGEAAKVEGDLEAMRLADDVIGAPSEEIRQAIQPKVFRVKDITNTRTKAYAEKMFGPEAELNHGQLATIDKMAFDQEVEQVSAMAAQKKISTAQAELRVMGKRFEPRIDQIARVILPINTSEGASRLAKVWPTRGAAAFQTGLGATVNIGMINQYGEIVDEEVDLGVAGQHFIRLTETLLSDVARAFGEKGVLTEFDISRARFNFPKLMDDKRLTEASIGNFRKWVKSLMEVDPTTVKNPLTSAEAQRRLLKEFRDLNKIDVIPTSVSEGIDLLNERFSGEK